MTGSDQSPAPSPGPSTGASLGERYDPLGVHLHDPYGFYRQARREEPVFYSAALNAWAVTRYDDVREVLSWPSST